MKTHCARPLPKTDPKGRAYRAWRNMKTRCRNPNPKRACHKWYRDRGIDVCERWAASFETFLADVGLPPTASHSLDRIDNDRGYEPGNVRWATSKEQVRNSRKVLMMTHDGFTGTLTDWAARLGITPTTLSWRLRHWTQERALTSPQTWRGSKTPTKETDNGTL